MARTKVTTRFKILEFIDRFVDNTTANAIGEAVTEEAKRLISEGQSPVRGIGRMAGYSETYKMAIKGDIKFRSFKNGGTVAILPPEKLNKKGNATLIKKNKKTGKFEARRERFAPGLGVGKQVRPVNLHLTGEMLEGYSFRVKGKDVIEVGIIHGSAERKEIAGYHQSGTENMPRRPLVPGEGEEFAVSVMRRIRDLYGKRLADVIRRANSKK